MDKDKLKYWCERLKVGIPKTYRVQKRQITNDNKRKYRFNGYCRQNDTLYYDHEWNDEDFVHELLHKRFPDFSHKAIKELTRIIVY